MRKFALIAAVLGIVLLGIHHQWGTSEPATTTTSTAAPDTVTPRPAAPTPTPTTPAATEAASTGPYGATEQARRAWEPIVQGFALAYPDTDGLTRKQWLANLRPYLTHDVTTALADTNLDQVPAGRYAGYQILRATDDTLTVRATYQQGWAVVLYLAATDRRHWVINALDIASDWDS